MTMAGPAFAVAPSPMAIVGADSEEPIRLLEANEALGALLGRPRRSLEGMRFAELVHPQDVSELGRLWLELDFAATGRVDGELRLLGDGNSTRAVRLRMARLPESTQRRETVLDIEDVTWIHEADAERRRLEQDLLEARRMESLGHLTGGVVHDFNSILAVIINCAAIAEESAGDEIA